MVCSQRVADDVPDGGGVGLRHLLHVVERSDRRAYRCRGQSEHLKEMPIKRNEILVDQGIASHKVVIKGECQQRTDRSATVGGQPVAVGNQHEQDLQSQCMVAEARPEAIA